MPDERPNPVVGVVTGGARALAAQFLSFYIAVPVKLFKPARIDYTALLRHTAKIPENQPYSFWTHTSPALVYRSIQNYGLRFIPDKLIPPIVANSIVGAVLYTVYLSSLTILERASGSESSPRMKHTFYAGGIAGLAQAVLATPLDSVTLRFNSDILTKRTNLWKYGKELLNKAGIRAAYGGLLLNAIRESSSFALFFSTFEFIKGPVYRSYADYWYAPGFFHPEGRETNRILYPSFVLIAGCVAAVTMQVVNYPLSKIQKLHTLRLQAIDLSPQKYKGWGAYLHAYTKTFQEARRRVAQVAAGSWLRWLYGGVGSYALYSMPSSSIGLLVFEIMRLRFEESPLRNGRLSAT